MDAQALDQLSHGLAPTDLQTLMLEVYQSRAAVQSPARLAERHKTGRFVRPSPLDAREILRFDQAAFDAAAHFEAIDLAPLCPLGTVSVLGSVHQNNVVSTSRNNEVVADSTNVMALECAARRRAGIEGVRLCSSHRVTRAQFIDQPNSWAHFRLFALCTAGRDTGSFRLESEAIIDHIGVYIRLINALREVGYEVGKVNVRLTDFTGERGEAVDRILSSLESSFPQVGFNLYPDRETGRGYYSPIGFHLYIDDKEGNRHFLADGGLTDWTAKLVQSKKERLMISGIGSERLVSLFAPGIKR